MKIHIFYNFQKGPWGGGNQFLKALKKEFEKMGIYESDPDKADAILFNSHHSLERCFRIKKKYSNKIIIYRLDGPISSVRGKDKEIDRIIALFNKLFVDGIIFQSNWCKEQNKKLFGISSKYETVIHNACDDKIFNKKDKKEFNSNQKIKLIAVSWSSNWRKGFEAYKYLDENLDFSRYKMTFVGNSPIKFKNIGHIKPVPSKELAKILKQNDVFIAASRNDPCSNSLIEALSCGLPAIVLNDGGHPELVQKGGELFGDKKELIEKIEKVVNNYQNYQSQILEFSIKKTAQDYYKFTERIFTDILENKYQPKKITFFAKFSFYKMELMILKQKILNRL